MRCGTLLRLTTLEQAKRTPSLYATFTLTNSSRFAGGEISVILFYDTCHSIYQTVLSIINTRLFGKWKKLDLTHNLTVIYFSRTYISRHESATEDFLPPSSWLKSTSPIHVDADGRYYEDHYKIVLENETRSDWESLIPIMKREFVNYPKGVKWK